MSQNRSDFSSHNSSFNFSIESGPRVLRAKDYIRRQFDLYGPPQAIFEGAKNDKYNWPTFKPAYYWNFPGFGSGYGTPYRRYSPVSYALSPIVPQYY